MYDMDELEIQNKVLLDITSRELKEEKDKWHRKYNDALIENAKLSKENEDYKMAIHRLIMERDMAIRDIKTAFIQVGCGSSICEICNACVCGEDFPLECGGTWRGVKR